MMRVMIVWCRIVGVLRSQADALIRPLGVPDQRLVSTVVTKSNEDPNWVLREWHEVSLWALAVPTADAVLAEV